MSRQLLINGLSAIVVIALVWWIASNTYWEEYDSNTGLQGEALTNRFYAAQRLAGLLGANAKLRHELLTTPQTNAVIVLGYWNWSVVPERRARLERWVRDGGRLVVGWQPLLDEEFNSWSGVKRSTVAVDSNTKPPSCPPGTGCPARDIPVVQEPNKPDTRLAICDLPQLTYLNTRRELSWRLNDTHFRPQVMRIPIGKGSVTIVNAEAFTGDALTCGDNSLLFVQTAQLHAGDPVEFLTEEDGSSLLQLIWTYGAPIVMLVAVWIVLWLWRSGARFGPLMAVPDPARRSLAEQILGTGRFTLRFGAGSALHAAAVRAFNETAARRVPHFEQLSGEARIEALSPAAGLSASELSVALDRAVARNPHELRKAITTLELARRKMAESAGHK
ncbi:MAG TPA: hypothetical protein VI653_00985 [Steroidobacteraceae bacterium]